MGTKKDNNSSDSSISTNRKIPNKISIKVLLAKEKLDWGGGVI